MADYTTIDRMDRYFSKVGVDAFSDHDTNLLQDTDVVDDVIVQSTDEINLYVLSKDRYDVEDLDGTNSNPPTVNTQLASWATVLALCFLSRRRGNPVPSSLAEECERVYERLVDVKDGKLNLHGVPRQGQGAPTFSNLQVERFRNYRKIRVTPNSNNDQTSLRQDRTAEAFDD